MRFWSMADGSPGKMINPQFRKYPASNALAISPDGLYLAVQGSGGEVVVYRLSDLGAVWGKQFDTLEHCLAFSPDNKCLAVATVRRM